MSGLEQVYINLTYAYSTDYIDELITANPPDVRVVDSIQS
jgi:hypothetical protein